MKILLFCLLLSSIVAVVVGDYHVVMPPPKFKGLDYIGTFLNSTNEENGDEDELQPQGRQSDVDNERHRGIEPTVYGEDIPTYFFMSRDKQTWTQARRLCSERTGNLGHLVQINSEAEDNAVHAYVTEQVPLNKIGEFIWTDGISDYLGTWYWDSNGAKMGYKNFAVKPISPDQYMTFLSVSSRNFEWSAAQPRDEKHYFMCESGPADRAKPCYVQTDLVIVMDRSGSIVDNSIPPLKDFNLEKKFAKELALAFPPPSRVGFVVYSTNVETMVTLGTSVQVASAVDNTQEPSGQTSTDYAIDAAVEQFKLKEKIKGVPQKIVVITDGESFRGNQYIMDKTSQAAIRAKNLGITTYSVGIGKIQQAELLNIAVGDKSRVWDVEKFSELQNEIRRMSITVCRRYKL